MRARRLVAWVSLLEPIGEAELRRHVADLLPAAMVPSAIMMLDELPTLPNGKVDRKALVAPGSARKGSGGPPTGLLEERLALVWASVLDSGHIGRDDDFFELGGDSLMAIEVALAIEQYFGRRLPFTQFFETPTLAGMTKAWKSRLSSAMKRDVTPFVHDVPLSCGSSGTEEASRLFCVPGLGGTSLELLGVAAVLPDAIAVYGFEAPSHRGLPAPKSLHALVAAYVDDLIAFMERDGEQGRAFVLTGYSFGGVVAFAMARLLVERGHPVDAVILVDPNLVRPRRWRLRLASARRRARQLVGQSKVRATASPSIRMNRSRETSIAPDRFEVRCEPLHVEQPTGSTGAVVRIRSTSATSATLDASVARWNIDSPANSPPMATPYRPPASVPSSSDHDSTLCAHPSSCSRTYASRTAALIHRPGRDGSAHVSMTSSKAVSTRISNRRSDRRNERVTRKPVERDHAARIR